MKKIFIIVLLNLAFCNVAFAESFYFKKCLLNEVISADYLIDLENKIINVTLKSSDGKIQEVKDKIELIERDKIVTEKIKSSKNTDIYFIYYLDVNTQSVIKQEYKHSKVGEYNLVKPFGPKKKSYCAEVKADWEQVKIKKHLKKINDDRAKKEMEIKKKKEKIKKENEKKRKEAENKYKVSITADKWIKISKYNDADNLKKKLVSDFDSKALEICLSKNKNKFDILEKKIRIVETDDTPAFGTETVIKIGIRGIVECI